MKLSFWRTLTGLKAAIGGAAGLAAIMLAAARFPTSFGHADSEARAFFYDESEHRLYEMPRTVIPPDFGIGGTQNDGVRAVVIAPRGRERDEASRHVAYLQTYSPELAATLRDIQTQRSSGGKPPALRGDDPQVVKGTLVREENDAEWFDLTTERGRHIANDWKQGLDEKGRPWVVCRP